MGFTCLSILSAEFHPLVLSAFLMLFQIFFLTIIVPVAKRCWDDDKQRKL